MVTHYPQWNNVNRNLLDCKFEVIFVVDRSGSMMSHWSATVSTLDVLLHALPQKCMFDIIGFGNTFQSLFPKSVLYNDDTMGNALNHCRTIRPDLGGTKLFEPLNHIFSLPTNKSYPRIIVVLTDGEVSN